MSISFKKQDIFTYVELGIYVLSFFVILGNGYILEPDSMGYLSFTEARPPGYVLFAMFFKMVFQQYYGFPIVIVQTIFSMLAIRHVVATLQSLYGINRFLRIFSLFFLLMPLLITFHTANKILSEAICYPLFLYLTALSLEGTIKKSIRSIFKALIILLLLILTRGQFLALIPVLALLFLYVISQKRFLLGITVFFIILFVIPLTAIFMEKTYNYVTFGSFITVPASHVPAASVFYVADKGDHNLFEIKEEKDFFIAVKDQLDQRNLTAVYSREHHYGSMFGYFQENFSNIANEVIRETAIGKYEKQGYSEKDRYLLADNFIQKLYWPLFKNNYKLWFRLFLENVRAVLGGTRYLVIHLLLFVVGLFILAVHKMPRLGTFLIFTNACVLSSIVLLALFTHSERRYVFYFDWVLPITMLILIHLTLRKVNGYSSENLSLSRKT